MLFRSDNSGDVIDPKVLRSTLEGFDSKAQSTEYLMGILGSKDFNSTIRRVKGENSDMLTYLNLAATKTDTEYQPFLATDAREEGMLQFRYRVETTR